MTARMSPAEARALTDEVKGDLARLRLKELEVVIERGHSVFIAVGLALLEIHESALYLETHETFESYCRERWGFERAHAYRLIAGARVVTALSPVGDVSPMGDMPANERQIRELAPLLDKPDELRKAWAEAQSEHPDGPTAADIREAVQRRNPVLTIPINEELLARQQRETLIRQLDQSVYALESPPSAAVAEAHRLLVEGDPGPFTPSRFDRVIEYATAFAKTLREAGIDG